MIIDCKWCHEEIDDSEPTVQDPVDGTPYHKACYEEMEAAEADVPDVQDSEP